MGQAPLQVCVAEACDAVAERHGRGDAEERVSLLVEGPMPVGKGKAHLQRGPIAQALSGKRATKSLGEESIPLLGRLAPEPCMDSDCGVPAKATSWRDATPLDANNVPAPQWRSTVLAALPGPDAAAGVPSAVQPVVAATASLASHATAAAPASAEAASALSPQAASIGAASSPPLASLASASAVAGGQPAERPPASVADVGSSPAAQAPVRPAAQAARLLAAKASTGAAAAAEAVGAAAGDSLQPSAEAHVGGADSAGGRARQGEGTRSEAVSSGAGEKEATEVAKATDDKRRRQSATRRRKQKQRASLRWKREAGADSASSSSEPADLDVGAGDVRLPAGDSCPADRSKQDLDRELKVLKKRGARRGASKARQQDAELAWLSSELSKDERMVKRDIFVSFYREQYARLAKEAKKKYGEASEELRPDEPDEPVVLDTSQYSDQQTSGLKLSGGHRPMPRPKGIRLPEDFRRPLGVLTAEQLRGFCCTSQRMLICVYGNLFDVSDRPDKYGHQGPYAYMAGHDITWGLVVGDDGEESLDFYYDVFKIRPSDIAERKLQGLASWTCFYEREYGSSVGRLDVYDREWELPEPPADQLGGCSVM